MAIHWNSTRKTSVNPSEEILSGLFQHPKSIASKFLYDDRGSQLFQKIMALPEYYLFNAELDIFKSQSRSMVDQLPFAGPFSVLELGAGDGTKTIELLKVLTTDPRFNQYIPIDISPEANHQLMDTMQRQLPNLKVKPITGNYFENLGDLIPTTESVLMLFLGSNIGNFKYPAIQNLVQYFSQNLKKGDALLLGMDLKKNPNRIAQAYNDKQGITRAFNLNLLHRINREFKADAQIEAFDFYSFYHPDTGEVRSYLVSLQDQIITIPTIDEKIHLHKNEYIHTEISKKFDFTEIKTLAENHGFQILQHFLDRNEDFTDTLWLK